MYEYLKITFFCSCSLYIYQAIYLFPWNRTHFPQACGSSDKGTCNYN